jgi:hypothetical protein
MERDVNMLKTTMANIVQAEAAKGKDVEQLVLGYLDETWNEAVETAAKVARDNRADVPCTSEIRKLKK